MVKRAFRVLQWVGIISIFVAWASGCSSSEKKVEADKEKQGLNSEEVSTVVNEHSAEIRNCYKKELDINPSLETKINIGFMIGPDGAVISAKPVKKNEAEKSTDPKMDRQLRRLEQCVVEKIKLWKFPQPRGGRKIRVVFPFVFKKV